MLPRSAVRRVASLVSGLCVGGALVVPATLLAQIPLPASVRRADDKDDKAREKNDKKDKDKGKEDGDKKDKGKNDNADKDEKKNGKSDNNVKPGVHGLPPHLLDVPVLDLPTCKYMALTKQPAIAAASASYQAALARQNALLTIRVPPFLARDLPIRKQQSNIGVTIAQFEVQRVQLDTLYSVSFGYLTAQYAAEQRALLDGSRERLLKLREGVKAGLKAGKTNIRKEDEPRVEMTLSVLDSRREEAVAGEQRAMSALREAMACDPHAPLILRATGQFRLQPTLAKDQLVADALARRPEIHQATLLIQVHGMEVDAQVTRSLFPTRPTFASGSDIHARPLPAGSYDENYRPAAVGPEMPVTINGNCPERGEIASAYHSRSGTVLEKTKILLTLETEQIYFRYVEACKKLPLLIDAARKAQAVFDATNSAFNKGERATTVRDWLAAGAAMTELRSQVNQNRYQMLVALAGLERATAGGYRPNFEQSPTSDPPEPDETDKDKEKDKEDNSDKEKDKDAEKLDDPKKDDKDSDVKKGKPKIEDEKKGKPGDNATMHRQGPNLWR